MVQYRQKGCLMNNTELLDLSVQAHLCATKKYRRRAIFEAAKKLVGDTSEEERAEVIALIFRTIIAPEPNELGKIEKRDPTVPLIIQIKCD